jgi:hypothetical protein
VSDPLSNLQTDVYERLNAWSFYQYTTVEKIREMTVASDIAQAMSCIKARNGKSGTVLLVYMASVQAEKQNTTGPISRGFILVRCMELPKTKTAGSPTAEALALEAVNVLHHFDPGYLGGPLVAAKDAMEPSLEFAPKIAYDVLFSFPLPLGQTVKPTTPQIANAGGNITITVVNPADVAIRYTLDGSYPSEAAGTLYAGAFATPAAGTRIRAVAYKADYQPSNCNEITI